MNRRTFALLILLASIWVQDVRTDNIRGPVVKIIRVDDSPDFGTPFAVEPEDLIGFSIDQDRLKFMAGLEIQFDVPPVLAEFRDSFALYLYKGIDPPLSEGTKAYRGTEAAFVVMPSRRRVLFTLPVAADHSLPSSFDMHVFETVILERDGAAIMTILPVMKGIPESVKGRSYTVTVRPLYFDRGELEIRIANMANIADIRISIDGVRVPYDSLGFLLDTGIHELRVAAPGFSAKTLNVGIEKAKTTVVEIELVPESPQLTFSVPEGTEIYFDGEKRKPGTVIETTPGDHTVVFLLGGHSVTKKITLEPGDRMTVSLVLDIILERK